MTTRSSTSETDYRIRNRLALLKESFEPSMLQNGGDSLASFRQSFDELLTDSVSSKNEETHRMVRAFVDIVATISSAILEMDAASKTIIHQKLEIDLARLADVEFKRLSINDRPEPANAPYIESCYTWLLANLHNPYPSKNVRRQFAEQSGAPEKDIDTWFVDTRKRIGWNDIRRAYFDTRFDMIKAATRHFKPALRRLRPDSNSDAGPSSDADFSHHFVTMESDARSLYAHKFFPTSLASNVGRSTKPTNKRKAATSSYPSPERTPSTSRDTTPVDSTVGRRSKRRHSDVDPDSLTASDPHPQRAFKRNRFVTPTTIADIDAASSLPSPAQSTIRDFSSSPAIMPTPLEDDTSLLNSRSKRKRRQSDASDYASDASRAPRAPRRRRGLDTHESLPPHLTASSKPELANLSHAINPPTELPTPSTSGVEQAAPKTSKRKRRLSDSQDDRPRKLPHHIALMAPRLQAVSNPFPVPNCVSGVDEIPASLSTDIPNFTGTLDLSQISDVEVESFDYRSFSALSDYLAQTNSASLDGSRELNLGPIIPSQAQLITPLQMPTSAMMNPFPDLSIEFSTAGQVSLPSYNDFFQDIQGVSSALLPEVWHNLPSTTNKQNLSASEQTFDSSFTHSGVPLLFQSSSVNPFDLLLNPVGSFPPALTSNTAAIPLGELSTQPFGDAPQVDFAIQKIQTLQAELDKCKSQLAQRGIFSF